MSPHFVCVSCGYAASKLYKKYSNVIKTINCDKCGKITDKYVEFEPLIVLVDTILLSSQAYRHSIYNGDFKLFWKLSLMLLLLESFALWRERGDSQLTDFVTNYEHGFYACCFQNILNNLLTATLQFGATLPLKYAMIRDYGVKAFYIIVLKANTLANFSKFFLLPIILWRDNTTEFGADLHRTLVMGHHLSAQILAYMIISGYNTLNASAIVLPVYFYKEYILQHFVNLIETYTFVNI